MFGTCMRCVFPLTEQCAKLFTNGGTSLMYAVFRGWERCVHELTKAAADVSSVDSNGRTPLHHASLGGHYNCVDLLIQLGADVNIADKDGDTWIVRTNL